MFFFIIGFGKTTVDYLGPAGVRVCPHCGNRAEWSFVRIRTWFTLFFIPVFPYKTVTVDMCPICHHGSGDYGDLPTAPRPSAWDS